MIETSEADAQQLAVGVLDANTAPAIMAPYLTAPYPAYLSLRRSHATT